VVPLLFSGAGCFTDGAGALLVPPETIPAGTVPRLPTAVAKAPATEEAARRAVAVGQKVLAANPQLGTRTLIFTIGGPEPEIFHTGVGQIFITEGLVRQCKTDGQLAAVLCHQLGKMAADQEMVTRALKTPDHGAPDDGHGSLGGTDELRLNDLARDDQAKRRAGPPPDPAALARQYLKKAGYSDADLDAVAPLLHNAESNEKFKQCITATPAEVKPPPGKSDH
jgi:hypothetical protein